MESEERARKSVLLVEDDEALREAVEEILRNEGYAVALAKNGAEGLSALRARSDFAVVLVDWLMPVLDGKAFLAELEKDPSQVPVVLMTAAMPPQISPRAQGVLRKPFELEELLRVVGRFAGDEV